MANILFINSVCYGSTGSICRNLYDYASTKGHNCCIAYGRGSCSDAYQTIKIGTNVDVGVHATKAIFFDKMGFASERATEKFIEEIVLFNPDIIHLHNLHGFYINIEVLFRFLSTLKKVKIVWTLHDCWAFTGHCAYYTFNRCFQWENGCIKCNQHSEYPPSLICDCKENFRRKKDLFLSLDNISIVCPSDWLHEEVKRSFLSKHEIITINNGIDTNIFKKTHSNIKDRFNLTEKKVILGVASVWDKRKGLDYFIELARLLSNDYKIVLIGLTEKQLKSIPKSILGLKRTEDVQELVEWYSAADVFVNPTLEDNYPTTNLEAIACGTPVITFNTGGSPESAFVGKCGYVVESDAMAIYNQILNLQKFNEVPNSLDLSYMSNQYLNIYEG